MELLFELVRFEVKWNETHVHFENGKMPFHQDNWFPQPISFPKKFPKVPQLPDAQSTGYPSGLLSHRTYLHDHMKNW